MAWVFFRAVSCRAIQSQNFEIERWNVDEPKSHLFLVHFSVLFLAIFE